MKKRNKKGFQLLKTWVLRAFLTVIGVWVAGILLFSFLPVPFSAVMVERQLGAWFSGNFSYVAHSDWTSMDDISPGCRWR